MGKSETKAWHIDWAIASSIPLTCGLRFSHNDQAVKVIELFIIWLTNGRRNLCKLKSSIYTSNVNPSTQFSTQWFKLYNNTALYFVSLLGFPIPNIKIQSLSSVSKKLEVKSSNKLITVHPNKDVFVRLLIASNLPKRCGELQTVFNPVFIH